MGDHYMLRRLIMGVALLAILPAIIMIIVWSAGGSKVMSSELQQKTMQEYTEKLNQRNADIIYLGSANYKKLVSEGILSSNMSHKEGTKSYITFYNRSHIHSCMEGFADDPVSMPLTGLGDEKTVVYMAVMALSKDELYWS